ncbi:MAG TPA: aminoglycoside phosphotransferase family protein [Candidatus Limnocylindrales bacterium]|nr:aminoglycoside phosphotransferase family protein [Candidatus Limnocylindrales bacterium]
MTVPDRLLGQRVLAVEDLTWPWACAVRTSRVTLAGGRSVVHQVGLPSAAGRAGIARRIRLARGLAASAPGLPVPRILDGDAAADPPFLVTVFVEGRNGGDLLESAADAIVLGRATGQAARAVAGVSLRGPATVLPRAWSEPSRLRAAAERWLTAARLDPLDAAAALEILGRVPGLFAAPPVLAHGDLAPVNLVIDAGRLAGILDLERLRVAPAAFDAAWVRLLVRHHHPGRWPDMGPALLDAAGLDGDPGTLRQLDDLAVLACLEAAATLPRRSTARTRWLGRIAEVVRGELPAP